MNIYYAKVQLPEVTALFKTAPELLNFKQDEPYSIFDTSILSDVAVEFFKSLNVNPKFIVFFNNPTSQHSGSIETRYIHADITLDENNKWKPVYCGINWELNPSTVSIFSWWDMRDNKAVWPKAIPQKDQYKILSGIHYSQRNLRGVRDGAVCLEEAVISGPTLVRTDMAHTVTFDSPDQPRIGVSIRFEETWHSWEQCLEIFKPIIQS